MTIDQHDPADPAVTVDAAGVDRDEYAAFTTLDGEEMILYARSNDRAWLQAEGYVSLADWR